MFTHLDYWQACGLDDDEDDGPRRNTKAEAEADAIAMTPWTTGRQISLIHWSGEAEIDDGREIGQSVDAIEVIECDF